MSCRNSEATETAEGKNRRFLLSMLKVRSETVHPWGRSEGTIHREIRHALRPRLRRKSLLSRVVLDPAYVEDFVEGCLERIGRDDPDEERIFRDLWDDEAQLEVVIESLKVDHEVRTGKPPGFEMRLGQWLMCGGLMGGYPRV